MMYPILCKVRYESLHHVFRERGIWIQIAFSVFVNWIIAPFLMVRPFTTSSRRNLLTYTSLARTGMGFSTRRTGASRRVDFSWTGQMHCYGTLLFLYDVPELD